MCIQLFNVYRCKCAGSTITSRIRPWLFFALRWSEHCCYDSASLACPYPPQHGEHYRMELFEGDNFSGQCVELCDDCPFLQARGLTKNCVNSIKVYGDGAYVSLQGVFDFTHRTSSRISWVFSSSLVDALWWTFANFLWPHPHISSSPSSPSSSGPLKVTLFSHVLHLVFNCAGGLI